MRKSGCVVSTLMAAASAAAQCTTVYESGGHPGAVTAQVFGTVAAGQVTCSTRWDPDGDGPEPVWLVVGGAFNRLDGVACQNVAAWDGGRWRALGAGVGTSQSGEVVYALATSNGQLYAGGRFLRSGANGPSLYGLARFDGTAWMPVGAGVPNANSGTVVCAIAEFGGDLYAGGGFGSFGAYNIARWNGTQWLPVFGGLGTSSTASSGRAPVMALHVHQGSLYAAGSFQTAFTPGGIVSIARLVPGSGWQPVGPGLGVSPFQTVVQDLMSDGEDLLAIGRLRELTPSSDGQIARWDGASWTPMITTPVATPLNSAARVNGELYVGSDLTQLLRLSGAALDPVGPLLSEPGQATSGDLRRVIVLGEVPTGAGAGVLVGGNFARTDTAALDWRFMNSCAVWDGSAFSPISPSPDRSISEFVRFGGDLYAVGTFIYANNQRCNRVARRVGNAWEPLGDGTGLNGRAYCAVEWSDRLVVGGIFTEAGGAGAARVAAWNGAAWEPMGAGVPESGVRKLLNVEGELLAVCGDFTRLTDGFAPTLRRWDGSAWVLFGDADGSDADVGVPVVHGGEMYLGGRVGTPGTVRWDGSDWVPIMNPNPPIGVVGVWRGELLGVGGGGTHRLLNGAWELMSTSTYGGIMGLATFEHQGEFYIGGTQQANSLPAVSRWNGAAWIGTSALMYNPPNTIGSYVSTFAEDDGVLLIGGALAGALNSGSTGLGFAPAVGFVRTDVPAAPVFVGASGGVSVSPGTTVTLSVDVIDPAQTSFQWRRDGVAITDGVQADLSTVNGATTDTMTIVNIAPSSSVYSVRATHSSSFCTATSVPMTVTVGQGCDPIDFNRDGVFPDPQDITDFLAVFGGGACPTAACGDVDFNNDGLFPDIADIEAFVGTLAGAACP